MIIRNSVLSKYTSSYISPWYNQNIFHGVDFAFFKYFNVAIVVVLYRVAMRNGLKLFKKTTKWFQITWNKKI